MKLSVIIPVFNEEKTISRLLGQVLAEKTPKEIIVIDDGSTDGTLRIVQSAILRQSSGQEFKVQSYSSKLKVLRNEKNLGKGAAVRKGIGRAIGEVLIIQDADLEYHPKYYRKLLEPILTGKAKVVYGSRLKKMKLKLWGNGKTPLPTHYLANFLLSRLTNLLYGSRLTDMETGYKVMTREVYRSLKLKSNRFEIEPEMTAKILRRGYKIIEVPITTKPRGYQEGKKIKAWDAVLAFWTLWRFWR
jgi:glycosyltransferase involved in cell wall biosynthesis